jgi:hypothetical protein
MAVTSKPWDGSAARFSNSEYARSCILDRADCSPAARDMPAKERYSLPIREPSGTLNASALGSAAAALSGARSPLKACPAAKAAAARKLLRAYGEAHMTPPDSLKQRAA